MCMLQTVLLRVEYDMEYDTIEDLPFIAEKCAQCLSTETINKIDFIGVVFLLFILPIFICVMHRMSLRRFPLLVMKFVKSYAV